VILLLLSIIQQQQHMVFFFFPSMILSHLSQKSNQEFCKPQSIQFHKNIKFWKTQPIWNMKFNMFNIDQPICTFVLFMLFIFMVVLFFFSGLDLKTNSVIPSLPFQPNATIDDRYCSASVIIDRLPFCCSPPSRFMDRRNRRSLSCRHIIFFLEIHISLKVWFFFFESLMVCFDSWGFAFVFNWNCVWKKNGLQLIETHFHETVVCEIVVYLPTV